MHYPAIVNFAALAQVVRARNQVLLVVATAHDCRFCEELKSNFLQPILADKNYQSKVLVGELSIDNPERQIVDFTGKPIRVSEIMRRYGIVGTPTMVFLNANNTQVHDPIFGVEIADFFFYTIEQAIETSHARL